MSHSTDLPACTRARHRCSLTTAHQPGATTPVATQPTCQTRS